MLTYDFEDIGLPLYEQIYRRIKEDILSGKIAPGEKLPSKRSFAKNNGISTITVQTAYDQLLSEGYLTALPRKGYYAAEIEHLTAQLSGKDFMVDSGGNSAAMTPAARIHIPEPQSPVLMDFSGNHMPTDNFPFSVWARLGRETISMQPQELMKVTPTGGSRVLREAIAGHLLSFRGMHIDPDQIIIGAGTEYLYGLLIQLLGDRQIYCIEDPGYNKLQRIYSHHNITCRYADMDDDGMIPDSLKASGANIAHISPNHHFPTGITMPASRRYELLSWAADRPDRYIIEDDYDSEFRVSGKPIPTLFSIDRQEKVIYINTFSKSLTPTIRISYMVLPVHLANRFYEQLSFYACTVSNFEQYTLAAFISGGYFEKHINRMRLYYSRQRKKIFDAISRSRLNELCTIIENDSGLHFLIRLDTHLSDDLVSERLKKEGIRMNALSDYYNRSTGRIRHTFIINYSSVDVDHAAKAFDTIYDCLMLP